ncbi:hypothetical protein [Mobiluncus mulieris]|uniref:hypothetical protein n=1 Tax=Mobiluncus mulieris TaxID=2052 RepID=UPI0014707528|nr:hypothetical protein [Mobiluncus mulieris]NMX12594.1 hypothetical protein [Mobiluncus mulieris]
MDKRLTITGLVLALVAAVVAALVSIPSVALAKGSAAGTGSSSSAVPTAQEQAFYRQAFGYEFTAEEHAKYLEFAGHVPTPEEVALYIQSSEAEQQMLDRAN